MTDGLRELYPGRSGACLMVFQSLLSWTGGASVVHSHCFSVPLTTEGCTGRPSAERRLMQKIHSGFTARLSSLPF